MMHQSVISSIEGLIVAGRAIAPYGKPIVVQRLI